MNFRTTIRMPENQGWLHHQSQVMLLGSCFSDNIGARMRQAMMNADVNPMGTLYNPLSIAQAVDRMIAATPEQGADLIEQGGVWQSYNFHSRFGLPDKQATLQRMNDRILLAHNNLRHCHALFLTLGTAVVYRLKATGQVVANCHKVPGHNFERRLVRSAEIAEVLHHTVQAVHDFNPQCRIIFTVSPIRHVADGLDTNSLSKAMLRVAIDSVMQVHSQCTSYFPAFEIMTDDLRDYRFYAPDMVHPSDVAIEYIWQALQASLLDDASTQAIARCERVSKRLAHRPMSNSREVVERWNTDTRLVLRNLLKEYPYLQPVLEPHMQD